MARANGSISDEPLIKNSRKIGPISDEPLIKNGRKMERSDWLPLINLKCTQNILSSSFLTIKSKIINGVVMILNVMFFYCLVSLHLPFLLSCGWVFIRRDNFNWLIISHY